jgi:hypothetical protein
MSSARVTARWALARVGGRKQMPVGQHSLRASSVIRQCHCRPESASTPHLSGSGWGQGPAMRGQSAAGKGPPEGPAVPSAKFSRAAGPGESRGPRRRVADAAPCSVLSGAGAGPKGGGAPQPGNAAAADGLRPCHDSHLEWRTAHRRSRCASCKSTSTDKIK